MPTNAQYSGRWDKLSVGVSLACAIHCIVLPVFYSSLTLFQIEIIENPVIEFLTVILSMAAGGWAVWKGYRKYHKSFSILLAFLAGLVLMTIGNAFDNGSLEQGFKLAGVLLVITSHYFNWKRSKHCDVCKMSHS